MFHFTRVQCTTPMRWHFEIYFSPRKRSLACLFHSAVLWDWQVVLWVLEEGLKGNLLQRVLSSPLITCGKRDGLACGRVVAMGGQDFAAQVEMAVSIKYHFQFPCFMIPRLLSTNNPPSAGPPTLSWRRLITLVASYKKDIYMKIRKQLLCLHGSESRTKAIPNLIFIQRRGKITISWRLIWVIFGGRAKRGAKTYVDWIKLTNYFHAMLMDVVFTQTMKMLQILWKRLLSTCLLHTAYTMYFCTED